MKILSAGITLFLFLSGSGSLCGQVCGKAQDYLSPSLRAGQQLDNLFSRTIAYRPTHGGEFDEVALRDSSTVAYTILGMKSDGIELKFNFRSDGVTDSAPINGFIREQGRSWCSPENKCSTMTDASGLLYNPLIWGERTGSLRVGDSWNVSIPVPWEFGAADSVQKVTVLSCDRKNKTLQLKREGDSSGAFAADRKELHIMKGNKKYTAALVPGKAHWIGMTVFWKGVVLSDELSVQRADVLKTEELGEISTEERQYMLLNLMPSESFSAK